MILFYSGSTLLGTGTLSGGTASFTTTTPLAVGNRTIKASYSGDSNSKTSSGTLTQTVNQDSTTTVLVSSADPSVSGQVVTFTATVKANAPGGGTPTGSVTFTNGSTTLATVALTNGAATYSTAKLATGQATITATYKGSGSFTTSSASLTQTINQDATTIKVSSSANPSVYGQSVTFTARVTAASPGSGTPTGTVTFYDGSTNLGSGTLSTGTATFSTTFFVLGSHSISVVYSGDTNFTTNTSSALSQTVNQDVTTTAVVSSVNPSVYGQAVTFTATVSAKAPGSGTPTGTITFFAGTTQLGTATLSGGTASFTTTSPLAAGNHTIKASYGGDTNFKTSSGTLTQTVNQDSTTTALVSSADPSVSGQW